MKGGLNVIMTNDEGKTKLFLRGDFEKPLTADEHTELLADLKPLAGKYEFHVSVETKI
ncbi:hypothetical protein [Leuconostoc citreum]|uniref:hypothetical protein n=1 Tax=Leuconostoc citreum TaxID=33964 RepID=UPI0012FD9223|nr:hypothetical protein [Leuconostoc citreum]